MREPLHYWRLRKGRSLSAYVHNARLRRIYWMPVTRELFAGSPLLARLRKAS